MITPTKFENNIYKHKHDGNFNVKNPNIIGIIQSIILFVDACLSSIAGIVVIFCIKNIDPPTNIGSTTVGSGLAKSSQKNVLSIGIAVSYTHLTLPTKRIV